MKFKNIKLSSVVTISILMLSFPLYKALSSEGNKLLIFLDALTITSLVMILLGVLYYNYLKGDFDASRYVLFRQRSGKEVDFYYALHHRDECSSEDYTEDISEGPCDDYWEATAANAIRPLYQLIAMAKLRPDGVWDGD